MVLFSQYGEEHVPEVEQLWSALCSWHTNLRITLNYLARLTCVCGNVGVMVQQAKKIMVSFSRTHPSAIVAELIRDLQVHVKAGYIAWCGSIEEECLCIHTCSQWISYLLTFNPVTLLHFTACQAVEDKGQLEKIRMVRGGQ